MKIIPAFRYCALLEKEGGGYSPLADEIRGMDLPRKSMVCVLPATHTFPAGTPHRVGEVLVFKDRVEHFHAGPWDERVPSGYVSLKEGLAIAPSRRLGRGRKMLREFLAAYPPVERCAQTHNLRTLVREGD